VRLRCLRRSGFVPRADEQSRHIIDRDTVDQRLQKIGACREKSQDSDDEKTLPIRPRQLDERTKCGQLVLGTCLMHPNPIAAEPDPACVAGSLLSRLVLPRSIEIRCE
jgi:hypothetical protein